MKKQRKHYAPEEKVAVLRRHLLEKEPISKLCDELGLQPTYLHHTKYLLTIVKQTHRINNTG